MADDIDLQDPDQVAALLRTALPSAVGCTPAVLTAQLPTLVASPHPAFALVGRAPAPSPEADEVVVTKAQVGPSPIRPGNKPWTDMLRRKSRYRYPIYALQAKHDRREPIHSAFTGDCQSVRVILPAKPPAAGSYIGTYLGKVEAKDHKLFSIEQVQDLYQQTYGNRPTVERVDLITGARFLGRRFSPVSIFLAYSKADSPDLPCFYILEGGSASGQPEALYPAKDMNAGIHHQAGFSFTPLTCSSNWYKGGLDMQPDMLDPKRVYLTAAQQKDGKFDYLDISVGYKLAKPKRVTAPFELQVEAALRVMAIAEQMGCELKPGAGGLLEPIVGPLVEALMPWDHRPSGTTTPAERLRYCGCPKSGATTVDPTPPLPAPPTPKPPT